MNFDEVSLGYTLDLAVKEAERCLQCKDPACIKGCPVNVPIPAFIRAIKGGDFQEAIAVIKDKNVLPAVCGRVCPQEEQCEKFCLLGKKNEPVSIGRLERFAADLEKTTCNICLPEIAAPTGKKVGVVGSAPSGLTCAYDLARLGHKVTIFEALHEAGGALLYGIPEFRLPKKIVAAEIELLKTMGIEIVLNAVIGKLITLDEILEKYDACFVGTGAGMPSFMEIEGENLNGVYSANEFLTQKVGQVDFVVRITYMVLLFGLSTFMLYEYFKLTKGTSATDKSKPVSDAGTSGLALKMQSLKIPPMIHLKVAGFHISVWVVLIVSAFTGFLAGFLGVGGGFIRMPSLMYVIGCPTRGAVGTDLFEIVVTGAYGAFSYAMKGRVELIAATVMLIGAAIGAQFGTLATQYVIRLSILSSPLVVGYGTIIGGCRRPGKAVSRC